jgi:hypothetical protein
MYVIYNAPCTIAFTPKVSRNPCEVGKECRAHLAIDNGFSVLRGEHDMQNDLRE